MSAPTNIAKAYQNRLRSDNPAEDFLWRFEIEFLIGQATGFPLETLIEMTRPMPVLIEQVAA